VIYLASTADAFVGLGHEVWRPLVLIGLALGGVFLGMLLRVRAFLFLGTGFVALGVHAISRVDTKVRSRFDDGKRVVGIPGSYTDARLCGGKNE
jgi:hypothetical protein